MKPTDNILTIETYFMVKEFGLDFLNLDSDIAYELISVHNAVIAFQTKKSRS